MAIKKTKKTSKNKASVPEPSMRLYRRIALGFVVVTALVLLAVVYASLVRAIIRITPLEQEITSSFFVEVKASPPAQNEVRGQLVARTVEISDEFSVTVDEEGAVPVSGKATGIVKITNNRSSAQPLVATTRFLHESGVLFRLDEATTVPGNGEVEVRISADIEGELGDIAAGHWTIPGLSVSAQELISGDTTEAMSGGMRFVNVLTQEDLDLAEKTLGINALVSVQEEMRASVPVFEGEAFFVETTERASDTPPGTETDRFTVSMTFNVVGVFFDEEELYTTAENKLYEGIGKGLRPVGIDEDALDISVERFDTDSQTATLRVALSGQAVPSAAHDALSRGVFSGMTPDEVVVYFEEHELAQTVEVELRPYWLKRVPKSQNKIRIIIAEN